MKQSSLCLMLIIFSITTLNAIEDNSASILCSNSIEKTISIKINSKNLNLTQDAVQDNLGGYVDIPEDKYYFKTTDNLYHVNGRVESNYDNNTNQFIATVETNSNKYLNIKKLYSLRDVKNLKLIQKIILDNQTNNLQYKTTTNILNISFNKTRFDKELKRCSK